MTGTDSIEHGAAVIVDEAIPEALGGGEAVEPICAAFAERIHAGTPIDAIFQTTHSLGKRLAAVLPRQ